MEQITVTKNALQYIHRLREGGEEFGMVLDNIALSFARLSQLIELGRDEDVIAPWTEDLQKVMFTLSSYTDLVQALSATSNKDSDLDTIVESRIICSFKLWHCMNNLKETIKNLQRIESYCKDEDEESLGEVISLLNEFDEDIERKIGN
jgi:hypothetical protein